MFNNLNIFEIQPTTVSTNLWEYSTIFLGLTGDGKTFSMNKYLNSVLPPNKKPLWILLEDRSKSVAGLNGVRVHNVPELLQVVAQLQNPQAKEMFGCVVFDTLDKLSDMLDKYIVDAKQVEVLGDLQYGKGNRLLNSKAQVLTEIRNMGYGVHFTCQLYKKEDFIKKTTSYVTTVPSTIKDRVFADAFFIGALKLDKTSKTPVTSDRLITFTKTSELPELKDGIGIGVKEVKIADLKDTLEKAFNNNYDSSALTKDKVYEEVTHMMTFEEAIKKGQEYGNKLMQNGKANEALNVLKTEIGVYEDGKPMSFTDLTDSQTDVAIVVMTKLKELCETYKL